MTSRRFAAAALLAVALAVPAARASAAGPASATSSASVRKASDLIDQERFPEAERTLVRRLAERPSDAEAIFYLGRVYLETGRVSEAVDYLEGMADRHADSSRIQQGLGEAYAIAALRASVFRQLSLARDSRHALERAIRLDPGNIDARVSLFEFYRHAPSVAGGGRDRANRQLDEIRRRAPARGYELQGHLLRDEGKDEEAIASYQRAVRTDPSALQARLSLVLALIEARRFDDAFDQIDAILERDPKHTSALYQLGRNAALSGRRLDEGEKALRSYLDRRPLRSQPSHAWAYYRLGMIEKRRGELASARWYLRKALSLDPDLDGARKVLDEIRI